MSHKKALILLSFLAYMPISHGFFASFAARMTWPRFLQGCVNNSIFGLIYYHLEQKGQEIKKSTKDFVQTAKVWDEAPDDLKKYNIHEFLAGNNPTNERLVNSLLPGKYIYYIDDKTFVSHQLLDKVKKGKFSQKAFRAAIEFEHERKQFASFKNAHALHRQLEGIIGKKESLVSKDEYAPLRFLEGIGEYMMIKALAKQIGSIFFTTKNIVFTRPPFIIFSTLSDFVLKFVAGYRNAETLRDQQWENAHQAVLQEWSDQAKDNRPLLKPEKPNPNNPEKIDDAIEIRKRSNPDLLGYEEYRRYCKKRKIVT